MDGATGKSLAGGQTFTHSASRRCRVPMMGALGTGSGVCRKSDDPTMLMKNHKLGGLTDQNHAGTAKFMIEKKGLGWIAGEDERTKKDSKMKVDPTISMKTKARGQNVAHKN